MSSKRGSTTAVATADLLRFLAAERHPPTIVDAAAIEEP